MSTARSDEPDVARLRAMARQRLDEAASTGTRTVLSAAAMHALMRLAATPEHAADALLLQQELEVHQIEIDAIADELRRRRP
jgi:hypothetical protein